MFVPTNTGGSPWFQTEVEGGVMWFGDPIAFYMHRHLALPLFFLSLIPFFFFFFFLIPFLFKLKVAFFPLSSQSNMNILD